MTLNRIKWTLFLVPAIVIGLFETIRHTLLKHILPMEIGNWGAALIDALVIALVSRTLLHQFDRAQRELSVERQAHAVLRERERLARVLHDQIAQAIFYSGVQIKTAKALANQYDAPELVEKLDEVTVSLREIDQNLRQSIFNLKEGAGSSGDLRHRIQAYLEKTLSRTGHTWHAEFQEPFPVFSPSEQVQVFGILQEAVTNVVKHAHASHVGLTLAPGNSKIPHESGFELRVQDNGRGFDAKVMEHTGHGLSIMESRARDIGAKLTLESGDFGTVVLVKQVKKESHKGVSATDRGSISHAENN